MNALSKKYGQWAVVTGASDGIGKAFSLALAEQGFNIVLVARREPVLAKVADQIRENYNVSAQIIATDLATEAGQLEVSENTASLDVGLYVGAAGFGTSGSFVENRLADELNMLNVNCQAIVNHCHSFANRFIARKKGAIILLSSLVAFQGTPNATHYAATKSFIQTLAEGLRVELAEHNIDVLAVAPGPVATGFAKRANMIMSGTDTPEAVARHALTRLGKCFTTRPGFFGKLLGYSLSLTPRWGRIQIMKKVMGEMTKHQSIEVVSNENV